MHFIRVHFIMCICRLCVVFITLSAHASTARLCVCMYLYVGRSGNQAKAVYQCICVPVLLPSNVWSAHAVPVNEANGRLELGISILTS